jgi:hypothetical protein
MLKFTLLMIGTASTWFTWDDGWSVRGCNASMRCRTDEILFGSGPACEVEADRARNNYPTLKFECVKRLKARRVDIAP